MNFIDRNPKPQDNEENSFKLGLHFPVNSKQPKFLWLANKIEVYKNDDVTVYKEKLNKDFLGYGRGSLSFSEAHNPPFKLNHCIWLWFRPEFLFDGSEENQCLKEMLQRYQHHDWRGPFLVVASPLGDGSSPDKYQDIALADARVVVQHFKNYGNMTSKTNEMSELKHLPSYKAARIITDYGCPLGDGVRIACLGDTKFLGFQKFTAQNIYQETRKVVETCQITMRMGISLDLHYIDSKARWGNIDVETLDFDPEENNEVWHLSHYNEDSQVSTWSGHGSVGVLRRDRREITPEQVEAICLYCQHQLYPAVKVCTSEEQRESVVKSLMTRGKFEKFFKLTKEEMIKKGNTSWETAISPFSAL